MPTDYSVPRTRFIIPRRRNDLVSRQRLLDSLDELLEKKLVLISAPAGYGKTSLLVDFASCTELPVCWYTVNSLDFDPQRFILNLVESIHVRFPPQENGRPFGQRVRTALQTNQGSLDVDQMANLLILDLYDHISEHFVLVLDDYHLVNQSVQIRDFMGRLLQDMDEECHIIITSRTLLSLPILPLMVARKEVGGISYEELAFNSEEIQQLFYQNHDHLLHQQNAGEILARTEGWVTGIILTTQVDPQQMAHQARLNRAAGVGLEEYFLQLINQQPAEVRDFLLRSSLLEEFDAERCRRVMGEALDQPHENFYRCMEEVRRGNLFALPVGEDGSWLRYHHLFLEFLQGRMRRERPAEAHLLEHRLAQFYAENGEWDNAFTLFCKLDMKVDLVKMIENAGPDLLVDGRLSTLSAWMDTVPPELSGEHPFILALQGNVAATSGDLNLALTLFNQSIDAMSLPQDRRSLSYALVWRAGTQRLKGSLNAAMADARETLDLVKNSLEMRRVGAEALRCIGICLRMQGKLQEARSWLDQALATTQSIQDRKNEAIIRLELGLLFENLGEYNQSMEMYHAALEYWQQTGNKIWLSNLLNNLGVLQHITGNYLEAVGTFERALKYARESGYAKLEAYILTGIGDIYGELEAVEEALQTYQQARLIAQRIQENFLQVYLNVQEVSLAGVDGFYASSSRLLEDARQIAGQDASAMEMHLCDLEYAGIKIREGDPGEVLETLEKACAFFEESGQKIQVEKASLYLALAYGQAGNLDKLIERLLKVLAFLDAEYSPVSLIATASRFYAALTALECPEYIRGQLDELFVRIERFRENLHIVRRNLRQHAKSVPFAPPAIHIRALGKMQVKVDNRLVTSSDWQTTIARDLFFLLLAHPEGMTKEEIGLIFWPDASLENVKFRFKNTVYRLRRALGKDLVLLDQNNYRFNNSMDYEYDVELFLRENARAQNEKESFKKLPHLREAIKLYKGDYLSEINETWVHAHREALKQIYMNLLLQVAEIYLDQANYDLALEYCQRALKEDDCLETAYRLSFRIYASMGNRAAVVRQYQRCCEVLQRELNTQPSDQTQSLYQGLLK